MNWNGLHLQLASDCEPDEDVLGEIVEVSDEAQAAELLTEAVVGLYSERAPDAKREAAIPVGLSVRYERTKNGLGVRCDIHDEPALRAWVEARLRSEDWERLHNAVASHRAAYRGEREDADRAYVRAVL